MFLDTDWSIKVLMILNYLANLDLPTLMFWKNANYIQFLLFPVIMFYKVSVKTESYSIQWILNHFF